ncbi:hypothetical protein [Streptomyces sp. NPDC048192]|uniref:hypothetical protein n=1 Tax=Streptomyces sp. NPDC048192 TaxID=3365510 RepID=UPI003722E0DE
MRTAKVGPTEITTVDGLPVTTAVRTITDLLRAGADGGHIGGVIADAERRDLIAVDDLAQRVQPFARKYGLKASAAGYDLISHLVAQGGETLRRQEVDRASQEGFDQAIHLLAERPELIELMWASRAAARQQSTPLPIASVFDPALTESVRKITRMDPAMQEAMRKALLPMTESVREALLPLMESVRKITKTDPALMRSIRKLSQQDAAMSKAIWKTAQPNLGIWRAVQHAAALPPATFKAVGQADTPSELLLLSWSP